MIASAKVILDSISPEGIRLPTMQLRYPRIIHAEFLTHRAFSRNARSSRAVPVATLAAEDIYVPHFMKNQPGMVATEEMSDEDRGACEIIWSEMAGHILRGVDKLRQRKAHKQWANRPLEWFGYIDVLVTATDWANFFALRDEASAQPEIQELARVMKAAMDASTPSLLQPGQWHLPYVDAQIEDDGQQSFRYYHVNEPHLQGMQFIDLETARKLSAARCARLSIKPFDGNDAIEAELARFERLLVSSPVHASPAEHQATPDVYHPYDDHDVGPGTWENLEEHGNFRGWRQFRKMIPNEAVKG